MGINTLSLSGLDATKFEILGNELFLKAGLLLDFEAVKNFKVTVAVDDATIGSSPDSSLALSLDITNIVGITPAASNAAVQLGTNEEDSLTGLGGANNLQGLGGNDTLKGGAGNDLLEGGDGNDLIFGNTGNDNLIGGLGNDNLYGGPGNDVLNGGGGIDRASYASATSAVSVNLNLVNQQNTLGDGFDTLSGIEHLFGSRFGDTLIGSKGANVLDGLLGNDTLTGGVGADKFLFNTALDGLSNHDTITDFNSVIDSIRLDNAVFSQLTQSGALEATNFISGANATAEDSNDYIVYDKTSGTLYYDADGSGADQPIAFVTLTGSQI